MHVQEHNTEFTVVNTFTTCRLMSGRSSGGQLRMALRRCQRTLKTRLTANVRQLGTCERASCKAGESVAMVDEQTCVMMWPVC
jgi:hypothetical protein